MTLNDRLPKFEIGTELDLSGCWLAGGAILSTVTKQPISDYDLYPKTQEDLEYIVNHLCTVATVTNISKNAITFMSWNNALKNEDDKCAIIQVILDTFKNTDEIFSRFDFTVCMAAYDIDTDEYTFHPLFWQDIASKTLHFNEGTMYPINSILRLNKYREKGFKIPKTQLLKMTIAAINEGMPTSWKNLEKQIGGVYGRQITLNADDMEFTIENVFKVLEDLLNIDFHTEDNSDKFSGLSYTELAVLTGIYDAKLYVMPSEKKDQELSSRLKKSEGYLIETDTKGVYKPLNHKLRKVLVDEFDLDVEELQPTDLVEGYKVLTPIEGSNEYWPSIRGSASKVKYKVGKETEQTKECRMGLFIFSTINHAKNRRLQPTKQKIFRVWTTVDNIHGFSYNEIETSKMMVIDEIKDK